MKMSRRTAVIGGAVVAAAQLVCGAVSTAAPASAAVARDGVVVYTTDGNPGGGAAFYPDGELLQVCDRQKDGLRVSAVLMWSDSSMSHHVRVEDANGSDPISNCATKDFAIAEGTKVAVEVCLRNGPSGALRFCDIVRTTA